VRRKKNELEFAMGVVMTRSVLSWIKRVVKRSEERGVKLHRVKLTQRDYLILWKAIELVKSGELKFVEEEDTTSMEVFGLPITYSNTDENLIECAPIVLSEEDENG